jgi:hypothetical protein
MSEGGLNKRRPKSYSNLFRDDTLEFLLGSEEPGKTHLLALASLWQERLRTERPQYPVRLNSSQVLWVRPDGDRTEAGYRSIDVFDAPPRVFEAIFAALTLLELESSPVHWQLHAALSSFTSPAEALDDYAISREQNDAVDPEQSQTEVNAPGLPADQLQALKYALTLLRYYRPEFDSLPPNVQRALMLGTCNRIRVFMDALHALMAFVEYGTPSGTPNKAVAAKSAARDVKASVLKDVDGLSYTEIGRRLGIPPSRHDEIKNDHVRARSMVRRGRGYLKKALGEDGWRQQIEAMKIEKEDTGQGGVHSR